MRNVDVVEGTLHVTYGEALDTDEPLSEQIRCDDMQWQVNPAPAPVARTAAPTSTVVQFSPGTFDQIAARVVELTAEKARRQRGKFASLVAACTIFLVGGALFYEPRTQQQVASFFVAMSENIHDLRQADPYSPEDVEMADYGSGPTHVSKHTLLIDVNLRKIQPVDTYMLSEINNRHELANVAIPAAYVRRSATHVPAAQTLFLSTDPTEAPAVKPPSERRLPSA